MKFSDHLHVDLSVPQTLYEDEDLLSIGSERAFMELQDPAYIKELGARALIAAQRMVNTASLAREILQDWGEVPERRRKKPNLIYSVPDLVEDEE